MCKVYNSIGSLTAIKTQLRIHNLNEFKSLNDLIGFQNNYLVTRQQIIADHSLLIEQEKNTLVEEIAALNDSINRRKSEVEQQLQIELENLKGQLDNTFSSQSNIFQAFIGYLKRRNIKAKIRRQELNFSFQIAYSVQQLGDILTKKNNRYQYVVAHFNEAVNESCLLRLQEHDRKKRVIDKINTSIYGAIGEQKVVRELENLTDDYFLINDFTCAFDPPIYNRQEHDYIRSIQIDHLLISPAGIFLIETKNWSEQSLNNLSLRSPVQQIKRTNFALFKILASEVSSSNLALTRHHWGHRKIPMRNLIVLTNHKPDEEFQHVKVLVLKELLSYIKYFKPIFSSTETQMIADYLLGLNGQLDDSHLKT